MYESPFGGTSSASAFTAIEFVECHPRLDLVALACENRLSFHRLSTGALVHAVPNAHPRGRITCAQFAPCGTYLATGGTDKCVRLWGPF